MARLKLKVSSRLVRKKTKKQTSYGKKHCRFCGKREDEHSIDYKNVNLLRAFITERGKILPSRVSGNCYFHQRQLAEHIKIARSMALVPYCPIHR